MNPADRKQAIGKPWELNRIADEVERALIEAYEAGRKDGMEDAATIARQFDAMLEKNGGWSMGVAEHIRNAARGEKK